MRRIASETMRDQRAVGAGDPAADPDLLPRRRAPFWLLVGSLSRDEWHDLDTRLIYRKVSLLNSATRV